MVWELIFKRIKFCLYLNFFVFLLKYEIRTQNDWLNNTRIPKEIVCDGNINIPLANNPEYRIILCYSIHNLRIGSSAQTVSTAVKLTYVTYCAYIFIVCIDQLLEVITMDPWFHFSQEDFTSFVKTIDTAERTALVKSSFQLHTRFCASKAKALCDLAYEILEYCMITELNFTALCYLMFSVWKELEHMMKSCSQDSRDMDFMTRFKLSVCISRYEQRKLTKK